MEVGLIMEKNDIFDKRCSVRKFTDDDVPDKDIEEMLKAAVKAPSGKNIQNWHFVIVKNSEKINDIAEIISVKNNKLRALIKDEDLKKNFKRYLKFSTHFKEAPVLVLIFASDYPVTGQDIMERAGSSESEIKTLLKADPGIQNIGAATENFMLKAADMGYGTCWMTSQNYAALEIQSYLGIDKDKYYLALITPLGVPAEEVNSPKRKDLSEVVTWIK